MSISNLNHITKNYEKLTSGRKLNRASDNPAGLIIAERLKSQRNGYDAGAQNAAASNDMLRVAEGGLTGITDNLQRIRELSIQASNFTYTAEDKEAIQEEINGLKESIQDAAKGTEFNTIKLLDGSMADQNTAINPDGTGMKIQIDSSTLETLGISNYDVTGNFNISDIDNALGQVALSRENVGSSMNRLEHGIHFNNYANQNLTNAESKLEDLDVGRTLSENQKEKVLQQYQMFAQSAKNVQMKYGFELLMNIG